MVAHDIIRRPIITEKSMDQVADRKYTFEVAKNANKIQIKKAVEKSLRLKSLRLLQLTTAESLKDRACSLEKELTGRKLL